MKMEETRCHQWTEVRKAPKRLQSQLPLSFCALTPQSRAVFTGVYVAISRLLRATTQCFSYSSRSFCSRQQCRRFSKSLNTSLHQDLIIVFFLTILHQGVTLRSASVYLCVHVSAHTCSEFMVSLMYNLQSKPITTILL